jgi:hypothetical protein
MQNKDGSFKNDALFHYWGKQGYFWGETIVTAFAIKALEK